MTTHQTPVAVRGRDAAELTFRAPHPRLADHVLIYIGKDCHPAQPRRRRVTAMTNMMLAIDFHADTHRTFTIGGAPARRLSASPVIGLSDQPFDVEQAGHEFGITALLTPLGARAVLGVPLHELTNTSIGSDAVLGAQGAILAERLASAPDWQRRFDILDHELTARIRAGWNLPRPLRAAWSLLQDSNGGLSISALADRIGWSRQHLNEVYRRELGLSLKTTARIIRLQHAVSLMRDGTFSSWADIAAASGYADQAHLSRDFRLLNGDSPTGFRTSTGDWDRVFAAEGPDRVLNSQDHHEIPLVFGPHLRPRQGRHRTKA